MADDLGEKTEDATPRRRRQAREDGKVAKSQDLAGALMLVGVVIAMWLVAQNLLMAGRDAIEKTLDTDVLTDPFDPAQAAAHAFALGAAGVRAVAPALILFWVAAAVSHGVQIGWLFAPKALKPSLNKLNPVNGVKQLFGMSALVKTGLSIAKLIVIGGMSLWTVNDHLAALMVLPYMEAVECVAAIGTFMLDLALRLLLLLVALGMLDFWYQKWKFQSDMKMTKHEVKDEMKQSEGDPETKKRRMRMAAEISRQRAQAAVPNADVIITNPEHISIAIRYDADTMHAPTVIAKGADYVALRIRQFAMQHSVPIVERKPLARALYKQVQVGQQIPPDFYAAVAEVLAYVYRLDGRMAG